MGQQLIGRPVSQRSSFPTLGTASSATAPDLSQYLGAITQPPQAPAQQMPNPAFSNMIRRGPFTNQQFNTLGFGYGPSRGFRGMLG